MLLDPRPALIYLQMQHLQRLLHSKPADAQRDEILYKRIDKLDAQLERLVPDQAKRRAVVDTMERYIRVLEREDD